MKAVFSADSTGRVTLEYTESDTGDRVTRSFSCPPDGGYVIEFLPNGNTKQVCDRLYAQGSTMMAGSRATLIDTIRREYRAMRAAERRENQSAYR